jgi:N-acyl amino acid synthase of PEP-CTERM/exosortase system
MTVSVMHDEALAEHKAGSLIEDFQEYFRLELATTPEQLESVYRIRFRVYCEEFGYEQAESFPDQQEKDEFDSVSSHCLITHKASGLPASCARLVHVDEQSLMPMEKYCHSCLDQDRIRAFDGKRDTICEFSRLAVDRAFRRRAGEQATRFGEVSTLDFSNRERRTFPLLAVSTILAAFAMSDLIERTHCFAMMEPFLPRLVKRSGMIAYPVGSKIDYHGVRAPYFFEAHQTVLGMVPEMQEFYGSIRENFEKSY